MSKLKSWLIVYGAYDKEERHAVDYLQSELSKHVGYSVSVRPESALTSTDKKEFRIAYVGTKENSQTVAQFFAK